MGNDIFVSENTTVPELRQTKFGIIPVAPLFLIVKFFLGSHDDSVRSASRYDESGFEDVSCGKR